MSKGLRLKEMVNDEKLLTLISVYDAVSARLIQEMGYQAAFISGAGISESFLGKPDVGLMGLTDNLTVSRNIAGCTDLYLLADADTGYGNAINVYHTVQSFEQAGVAGIMIEDQTWPKRCGHLSGKSTISAEEMLEKIHAAIDAKKDPDFIILARTDSAGTVGLDEAIRRANLYAEAGADLLFADALLSKEDIRTFVENVNGPVMVNMGLGIRQRNTTPLCSPSELEEMGVAVVSYSRLLTAAAIQGMKNAVSVIQEMTETGELIEKPELLVSFQELNQIMGFEDFEILEKKYGMNK